MKKILKVLCLMIVQISILVLGCDMAAIAGTDVDSIKEDYKVHVKAIIPNRKERLQVYCLLAFFSM